MAHLFLSVQRNQHDLNKNKQTIKPNNELDLSNAISNNSKYPLRDFDYSSQQLKENHKNLFPKDKVNINESSKKIDININIKQEITYKGNN